MGERLKFKSTSLANREKFCEIILTHIDLKDVEMP